jgi:hypothetical protein
VEDAMAREAQYTENVSFLATEQMKANIERLAGNAKVSAGEVWRYAVEHGYGATRREYTLRADVKAAALETDTANA